MKPTRDRQTGSLRPFGRWGRSLLLLGAGLVPLVGQAGCGYSRPAPEPKVPSFVGQRSVCHHCRKEIASIQPEQLVTLEGMQYAVCSDRCARELERMFVR